MSVASGVCRMGYNVGEGLEDTTSQTLMGNKERAAKNRHRLYVAESLVLLS